jgi:serine/threonine protein kinase
LGGAQERYRILEKIGEGCMGEVYLAEHVALGRREAVKVLHPRIANDAQFVSRFQREARATNRVQHPNIVSVYDFGQLPDGRFFLAMEYAEGERLDAVLRREGALPIGRAVRILRQLADAIYCAHSSGVVHRDLKPANLILVEHRGQPDTLKVLDFGMAKIIAPEYQEKVRLSLKGEVFGSPAYIAPEQWKGVQTDPRSDLYAFGCIAYEVLLGTPPFRGHLAELMEQHLKATPTPPRERRAEIPAMLDKLVMSCLAKEPAARLPTAQDVLWAIDRAVSLAPMVGTTTLRDPAWVSRDTLESPDALVSTQRDTRNTAPEVPAIARNTMARWATVMAIAQAIRDLGTPSAELVTPMANVDGRERERAVCAGHLSASEVRVAELEQAAREQEAALRFAIAELSFERTTLESQNAPVPADLQFQIDELEKRVRTVLDDTKAKVNAQSDTSMALAVDLSKAEEAMAETYAELEAQILGVVPRFEDNPVVSTLARRLQKLRQEAAGKSNP